MTWTGAVASKAPKHRKANAGELARISNQPLSAKSKWAAKALEEETARVAHANEGERNDTLNAAAFALGQIVAGGELAEHEVIDALSGAARCAGLNDSEIAGTIASGLRAGAESPRTPPPKPSLAQHAPLLGSNGGGSPGPERFDDDELDASSEAAGDDWPDLVPLSSIGKLPPFPLEVLPTELADWAQATATATQTPVDLPALLSLAVLSAVVAKRYEVQVRSGWVEPLNLYVTVAAPPGDRKSPVFRAAMRPVLSFERDVAAELAPEIAKATTRRDIKDRAHKKAIDQAAKTGDGLHAHEAEELGAELAGIRLPVVPRHFADDVTPEKLASLMAEQGGRMGLLSSEGGIFETMAGRYSDGVVNLDLMLKAYSGDHFRADRVRREPVVIQAPALTVGLTVQPDVIQGLAARKELRGRGLLGRFLYALPQSLVGRRDVNPPPVPLAVASAYEALVQRLLAGDPKRDEYGEIEPVRLHLGPEAQAQLNDFMTALESRLGPGCDLEPVRDWATKLAGALVRIAGLLHLASGNVGIMVIPVLNRGLLSLLSLYLTEHARAAFALMGADESTAGAQKILNWCEKRELQAFTKRDAWQGCKGSFDKADDLDKPLEKLVEHGYIRPAPQPDRTGVPGRRPSPLYLLSPRRHNSRNDQNGHGASDGGGS